MFDWLFGWISKPEYQWTLVEDKLPQMLLAVIIVVTLICIGILANEIKSGKDK